MWLSNFYWVNHPMLLTMLLFPKVVKKAMAIVFCFWHELQNNLCANRVKLLTQDLTKQLSI